MQKETPSYDALLQGLENLAVCLYPTASEGRVRELREELRTIRDGSTSVKSSISQRQLTFLGFTNISSWCLLDKFHVPNNKFYK